MKKIIVLSDGCRPTEDIYFWRSARPYVKERTAYKITRIDCQRKLPNAYELPEKAHYLIFRSLPDVWIRFFSERNYGNLYFVIDDCLEAAKDSITMPENYRNKLKRLAQRLPIMSKIASKVIVTSSGLEKSCAHYSPLRLNPSILDLSPRLSNFSQDSWKLAYHGTSVHAEDFRIISPAVMNILAEYPQTVFESLLGSHTPTGLKKQLGCYCIRPMPWSTYLQFRKFTRMHIGLAPLMDTPFNKGKSWNKFLEITVSGGVGIYSKRAPYSEVVDDGINGLLTEDDPDHWEECIQRLIRDSKKAKKMAENAKEKALSIGHPKWSYRFWRRLLEG